MKGVSRTHLIMLSGLLFTLLITSVLLRNEASESQCPQCPPGDHPLSLGGTIVDRSALTRDKITTTAFDTAYDIAYSSATAPVVAVRQEFDLSSWNQKTGGGLKDTDRQLLAEYYYAASSIFEFGVGESTLIAAHTNVPRYTGVDSDPVYIAEARLKTKRDHFRFHFSDIGKTRDWGNPENPELQKIVFNYQMSPLYVEKKPFDFYLVDGRYRVACVLLSFLHALKRNMKREDITVGIHDASDLGRGYSVLLQVTYTVKTSEKLWILKLKDNVEQEEILSLWKEYRFKQG